MLFVSIFSMFLATKGYVQLQVSLNDELRIIPMVSISELAMSAKAIATSIKSILNVQIKGLSDHDKEAVVKEYFKSKGWHLES